jgi:hypothetical protein
MEKKVIIENTGEIAIKRRQKWHIQCWDNATTKNGFWAEGPQKNLKEDEILQASTWEVELPAEGIFKGFTIVNGAVTPIELHCTHEGVSMQ